MHDRPAHGRQWKVILFHHWLFMVTADAFRRSLRIFIVPRGFHL